MKTVIIADDLTGACDTAVKLCGGGRSVNVYLNNQIAKIEEPGAAINTNSRSLSPEEAFEKLSVIARELKRQSGIRIYKKIDSLFRGNVTVEAEALRTILGYQSILINSAVPGNHRAVRNGKLSAPDSICDGLDIIPSVFCGKEEECVSIPLETVRAGSAALAAEIEKFISAGIKYLIVDSETEADLTVSAEAAGLFEDTVLPAGAAGFIAPLAKIQKCRSRKTNERNLRKKNGGPLLFVLGTNNPVTVNQIKHLKRVENVPMVTVHAKEILSGKTAAERNRCISEAECIMQSDPELLLLTVAETDSETPAPVFDAAAENAEIAACCTDIAVSLAETFPFRGMVVSGGTTAQLLLEKMRIPSLTVLSEFAPGIPIAKIESRQYESMLIATKSGGYGEKETLSDLKAYL